MTVSNVEVSPQFGLRYTINWEIPLRIALIVAMVGTGIGTLAEAVKLASSGLREGR